VIVREHGAVLTGHTYSGHTTACAAGLAVQRIIDRDSLLERVRTNGELLRETLRDRLAQFAAVGDVRGRGYFIGVELVCDRATKAPFPQERGLSQQVASRAFQDGLICFPCAGNAGGGLGDTLIIAPPFNATDGELSELVEKLVRALSGVL
jgi:adenosylmethionine-8-amino-7-oxononanoate aminotransferase